MPLGGAVQSSRDEQADKEQLASKKALIEQLRSRIEQLKSEISRHETTRKKYEGLKLKVKYYEERDQTHEVHAASYQHDNQELNQRYETTSNNLKLAEQRICELEQEIFRLNEQGRSRAQELGQSQQLANGLQLHLLSAQQAIYQLQQQLANAQQEAHAQQEAQRLRLELVKAQKKVLELRRQLPQEQQLEQGATGNGVRHRASVHMDSSKDFQQQVIPNSSPPQFWAAAPSDDRDGHSGSRGAIYHNGKRVV